MVSVIVTVVHDEYGDTHLVKGIPTDKADWSFCPSCGTTNHVSFKILIPVDDPTMISIVEATS